jgi:hypothetical protein
MSVLSYFYDPANGFTAAEQAMLDQWYTDFDIDDAWRLIRRNFDRDCARQDISHFVLRDYLRDIAKNYQPNVSDAPLAVMDQVYSARKSYFLLPGQSLASTGRKVARVVRADHLLKYQLHPAGIAVTMGLNAFISALKASTITGRDLDRSHMGRADHPVWVCPADRLPGNANDCRDQLGLHHISHGHLASIEYPESILAGPLTLRAPTTIDSAAGGADNWIFGKRAPPGGPGWGHAVDLATSKAGVDEAVHRDFAIDTAKAGTMTLGHVGQIGKSPPPVDYSILLTSI